MTRLSKQLLWIQNVFSRSFFLFLSLRKRRPNTVFFFRVFVPSENRGISEYTHQKVHHSVPESARLVFFHGMCPKSSRPSWAAVCRGACGSGQRELQEPWSAAGGVRMSLVHGSGATRRDEAPSDMPSPGGTEEGHHEATGRHPIRWLRPRSSFLVPDSSRS